MYKFIKIALFALSSLILLIIIGATALLIFIDPNDYKEDINKQVYLKTGCQLTIAGDINWSFFPSLGLQLRDVTVNNPPGFNTKPFAHLGMVDIRVRLLPLLSNEIKTNSLVLQDLNVNLIENTKGEGNWDSFVAYLSSMQKKNIADKQSESIQNKKAPMSVFAAKDKLENFSLFIDNFLVKNATLTWDDQLKNQQASINVPVFRSKNINFGNKAFPIKLDMTVYSYYPETKAQLKFSSHVCAHTKNYTLQDLKLQAQLSGPTVPEGKVIFKLDSDAEFDISNDKFNISQFMTSLNDLAIKGQVSGQIKGPTYSGRVSIPTFNLSDWLKSFNKDIQIPDPTQLNSAMADMQFKSLPSQFQISSFAVSLGESQLTGDFSLQLTEPRDMKMDVSIDTLDLSKWFPLSFSKSQLQQSSPTHTNLQSGSDANLLLWHRLKSFIQQETLHANVKLSTMQFLGLQVSDIAAKLKISTNKVTFGFNNAKFYQGKISGVSAVQFDSKHPSFDFSHVLTNVRLSPLLKDLWGISDVSGIANMNVNLKGQGSSWKQIVPQLRGNIDVAISAGQVKVLDILYLLNLAHAKFEHEAKPTQPKHPSTDFQQLTMTFDVNHGIAKTNNILLLAANLEVYGKGSVDLVSERVSIGLDVVYKSKSQNILSLQDMAGGSIPLIIRGSIHKLRADLNYPLLLKRIAEVRLGKKIKSFNKVLMNANKEVSEQVDKASDELNKSLEGIGDKLQQLFQ